MKNFRDISEAKGDTAVFTFGRFNPPTTGHEKVMEALAAEQKKNAGSMMYVFTHFAMKVFSVDSPLRFQITLKFSLSKT